MSKKIWTFDHEPKSLDKMILDEKHREKLQKVIDEVPNVFLYGSQGIGKGTFVNIFLNETGYDYLKINASDENSVDDVRTKIKSFATSLGSTELKIVYLNECDRLSHNAQDAILDLLERVQKNTRFIFVGNYDKLTPELKSRCQVINLDNPPAKEIYHFCIKVLEKENVTIKNKKNIVDIIKKLYPDIRHVINTLQLNTNEGVLDDITFSSNEDFYVQILDQLKNKNLEEIKKSLKSNIINYPELYNYLFENVGEFSSPGNMIIEISEALKWDSQISIKEINFLGMVTKAIKNGYV